MIGELQAFHAAILKWYTSHHRALPWRAVGESSHTKLNPYHVLISEAMLQQTQVSTVIPYYHRFLTSFPTIDSLATAPTETVLRAWQGLGYYSRARNLQKAALEIMSRFNGKVPSDLDDLLSLPGVGRYTAGAIASIAFNQPAPILDGNVSRVLVRLDAIRSDPRDKKTIQLLWTRAHEILPKKRLGDFNSSLMELGATICTPKSPQCLLCPVQKHCRAFAAGIQEQIPPPKKSKPTPLESRLTLCIRHNDTYLIERRPPKGRWAGMWQFLTFPTAAPQKKTLSAKTIHTLTGLTTSPATHLTTLSHTLTHRQYQFQVYTTTLTTRPPTLLPNQAWVSLTSLDQYPLPLPHLKIAALLAKS